MSASSVIEREGVAGLSDGEQVAIERYDKTRTVRKWSRRGDTTPLVIESHLWRNQKRLSNFFFFFGFTPKLTRGAWHETVLPTTKAKKKKYINKKKERECLRRQRNRLVWETPCME